jgi:hypothetical protein
VQSATSCPARYRELRAVQLAARMQAQTAATDADGAVCIPRAATRGCRRCKVVRVCCAINALDWWHDTLRRA